jgi:PAS domain-containing protein
MRTDPLTGEETPWVFRRDYGCNYIIGSENLLTFRSGAAGFLDLKNDGGTGTFGGFRSGCTSNLIAANGVLNAPDYTRTCSCSYQNQTSLALVHMPELEIWTTYYNRPKNVSMEETKTAVLIAENDATLSFGNTAFRELIRLDENREISDISLSSLVEDPDTIDLILGSLKQERSWLGTVQISKGDGSTQEVHVIASVLSDTVFAPAAMIFLFADSADSAVAFLDLSGELTYVDDTFLDLWQLGDESEALERSFEQLWQGEAAKSVVKGWRLGQDWSGQLSAVRQNRPTRDVHVISRVVRNEAGQPVSAVVTCFDVTERRELEAEAAKLVKHLGSGVDLRYFINRRPPIQRAGINFGAPGDRKAENGTLWLEWPSNEGPSPEIRLEVSPEKFEVFAHHSSWAICDAPRWIVASGLSGVSQITLWLADGTPSRRPLPERIYKVRLYFIEPEDLEPGDRRFDIKLQEETVIEDFDIVQEAGRPRTAVVKIVEGVSVGDLLQVQLSPAENSRIDEALICGIEVIAQE